MWKLTIGILGLASGFSLSSFACPDFLDTEMRKLASKEVINFCEAYGDNPLLIVNTASNCVIHTSSPDWSRYTRDISPMGWSF